MLWLIKQFLKPFFAAVSGLFYLP